MPRGKKNVTAAPTTAVVAKKEVAAPVATIKKKRSAPRTSSPGRIIITVKLIRRNFEEPEVRRGLEIFLKDMLEQNPKFYAPQNPLVLENYVGKWRLVLPNIMACCFDAREIIAEEKAQAKADKQ